MPKYHITAGGRTYEVQAADDAQAGRLEGFIKGRVAVGDFDLKGAAPPEKAAVNRPDPTSAPEPSTPWYNTLGFSVGGAQDAYAEAIAKQQSRGGLANLVAAGSGATPPPAPSNIMSTIMQGATLGSMDEIAGGANAIGNMIASPFMSSVDFDPVGAYNRGRDQELAVVDATRREHPWLATGSELLGGLLSARPTGGGALSLGATVKQGAKTGSMMGAAYGFNSGDGLGNRLTGAGIGGTGGALLGAGLPLAAKLTGVPIKAAMNYVRPQNGLGANLVSRALLQDGVSGRAAGTAIQEARGRGVPLSLADLGDNVRGLAGSVSRKPGVSRTLARNAVVSRQEGQAERIQDAITRDLGPTGYVPQMSDDLIARGRAASKPLYDEAYAAPAISSPELESLLATPAGRQALSHARTIAANERKNPEQLGFHLDAEGNVVLSPVQRIAEDGAIVSEADRVSAYSPETVDYVKRGLDSVLEGKRDLVTGRLPTDAATQSVQTVRQSFVREADRLNPAYAQARAAYAEPAKAAEALRLGQSAVNASADDIQRMTARLTPAEREQFALGYRSSLSEAVARRTDGGNKAAALNNSPRKRAALDFGTGANGNMFRFGQTLDDENAAYQTYHTITGGSPTANRLADDAVTEDAGMLADMAGSAIRGASRGGATGMVAELIGRARDVGKFGAGKTGERAREDAAGLLFESDPAAIANALRDARKIGLERRKALVRANQRTLQTVGMFGRGIGGVSAYGSRPVE